MKIKILSAYYGVEIDTIVDAAVQNDKTQAFFFDETQCGWFIPDTNFQIVDKHSNNNDNNESIIDKESFNNITQALVNLSNR